MILFFSFTVLFAVVEETESLSAFLYGDAPNCEYGNWISHVVEGIASAGYNQYAPWDVQNNGFGNFVIPSENELDIWNDVVEHFVAGNLSIAESILSLAQLPYQVVIFHDTDSDRTFNMLREIPNLDYYDGNSTFDTADDEVGAFDYGWGLYILYPEGENPHITTAPHPNDDYISIPLAHKAFIEHESKFLLISGVGREVVWTEVGNYTNSKSLCDPSRVEEHPFNICYQQFCESIRTEFGQHEFSLQIHSYDWGASHAGFPNVQISAGYYAGSPDLPIRDHSSLKLDIPNASGEIVVSANSVGLHPDVPLNEYYSFHCNEYEFCFANEDTTFAVNTGIDLCGYSQNRQILFTQNGMSHHDNFERFLHLEMDELPNVYAQTEQNYHWFHGWNAIENRWDIQHRFDRPIAYYSVWIEASKNVLMSLYEMDDNLIPTPPSNLEIISAHSNEIAVRWDKGDSYDVETYQILYANEPFYDLQNCSIIDKNDFSKLACLAQETFTLEDVEADLPYYFAVRIKDKNGNFSEISNIVIGMVGNVSVNYFNCVNRDSSVELNWRATSDSDFQGFNVLRKSENSDFELIDSWLSNPDLAGQNGYNVLYEFIDSDLQNGMEYVYKLSFHKNNTEFTVDDLEYGNPEKIYQIVAFQQNGIFADTCYFGYNKDATDGYNSNYDFDADDSTSGDYFFAQFYEEDWTTHQELYQNIVKNYNPSTDVKSWAFRVRTNQLSEPVEIGISNFDRDLGSFYLLENDEIYTNLVSENYIFTPNSTGFYEFTLLYGNVNPSVNFTTIPNQILRAGAVAYFTWQIEQIMDIDNINVYIENDNESIVIGEELPATTTEIIWDIPEINAPNLRLKLELIMSDGSILNHFSEYRIGVIPSTYSIQTEVGWSLMAKSFETDEFSAAEIFGSESIFYEFYLEEFSETNELDFLKSYWMHAFAENEVVLNDFEMVSNEYYIDLTEGWNLIPNPHLAIYNAEQLIFSVNNGEYEFYDAVQNGLIEPAIYEFDNYFNSVEQMIPSTAYYLYSYDDDISLRFIPFYENLSSPEFPLDWKLKIVAEQSDFSAVTVGTSPQADSLYNPYYDYLKPTHKPFEDDISFYVVDNSDESRKLHQSITAPQNPNADFSYLWNARLELNSLEPILFEKKEDDIPENHNIYLQIDGETLDLSEVNFAEFTPSDTLLQITILVTDADVSDAEDDCELEITKQKLRNYPNPFNGRTTISFALNSGITENIVIVIYNIKGQKVETLSNIEIDKSGNYQIVWDASKFASGIYFYKLSGNGKTIATKKMLLLK